MADFFVYASAQTQQNPQGRLFPLRQKAQVVQRSKLLEGMIHHESNQYQSKVRQMNRTKILAMNTAAIAVLFVLAGCASIPAPTEQMAVSRAAVNTASSAGGGEFAPLQFKAAMDKMDGAERAMIEKDYVLARQLAEQAEVDAQLAGAMARSAKAKKAADALQEDSRVLRQEIERKTQ